MQVEYYYSYASQLIQRPPIRCVVVGESNTSVEAAHELGMKCVVVTGNRPVYDFVGADLVVRNLSQISFFNLKRLFGAEDPVPSRILGDEQQLQGEAYAVCQLKLLVQPSIRSLCRQHADIGLPCQHARAESHADTCLLCVFVCTCRRGGGHC